MNMRFFLLLATAVVTVTAQASYYSRANGIESVPPIEAPEIFLREPTEALKFASDADAARRFLPAESSRLRLVSSGKARTISRMPMTPGNATDPWMPMLREDPALEGKLLFAPIEVQPAAK